MKTTIEIPSKFIDHFDKFCEDWEYQYGKEIIAINAPKDSYQFNVAKETAYALKSNLDYIKILTL
jgi:hypothetical protein